ncbi:MAG: nucleoside monophosphate kinase [Candidatus Doudnabacteria bacterium]|nr:nucleoside monophosphate kinase [Candidatus Doudnabacteria bacterium]
MDTKLGFDLVLLGAPAAGKDTQAGILMKRYQFSPIESGKHWRQMAAKKNEMGLLLRKTFSKGQAAPVKLMKQFIIEHLRDVRKSQNLLFIGNPRLKPEAQLLNKLLLSKHRDYYVISIELPEKEIRKRSLKRMRDDQDWKYVDNRINMYELQVAKTLDYFNSLGKLKTVNGNRSIKEVSKDIEKIINDYKRRQAVRNSQEKRTHSGRSFKFGRK